MEHASPNAPLGRRDLLARLAGIAFSFSGLSAFRKLAPAVERVVAPKWDDRFELAVDLEIAPQQGYRYHRPYVAVWIEDPGGRPVRTLILWVNTSGRGPRYIRELRRWISGERDREEAGGPELVASVSSATRLPGRYTVTWDGRDDQGRVVQQGDYRILIEAAREHGSYRLMQQEMTLATKPAAAELAGNEEISRAHVEFRRRR